MVVWLTGNACRYFQCVQCVFSLSLSLSYTAFFLSQAAGESLAPDSVICHSRLDSNTVNFLATRCTIRVFKIVMFRPIVRIPLWESTDGRHLV